jgi:ABC-type nickel/cobalt efflux system permease component RcnA
MARRWIPRVCGGIFVAGIAGLIISSVAGNNAGFVLSIGLAIVFAAIALLTYAAVTAKDRIEPFDDARAEGLEQQVQSLVQSGAPEEQVRALVRDAMRVGRR